MQPCSSLLMLGLAPPGRADASPSNKAEPQPRFEDLPHDVLKDVVVACRDVGLSHATLMSVCPSLSRAAFGHLQHQLKVAQRSLPNAPPHLAQTEWLGIKQATDGIYEAAGWPMVSPAPLYARRIFNDETNESVWPPVCAPFAPALCGTSQRAVQQLVQDAFDAGPKAFLRSMKSWVAQEAAQTNITTAETLTQMLMQAYQDGTEYVHLNGCPLRSLPEAILRMSKLECLYGDMDYYLDDIDTAALAHLARRAEALGIEIVLNREAYRGEVMLIQF